MSQWVSACWRQSNRPAKDLVMPMDLASRWTTAESVVVLIVLCSKRASSMVFVLEGAARREQF
jgi:hypothetical protein